MRIVKVLLCLVNVSYSHKYSWQAGWGELVSGARHLLILLFKVTTNQFCWPGLGTGPALGWGSQHIAQQQQQVLRGGGVSTHHYHYSLFFITGYNIMITSTSRNFLPKLVKALFYIRAWWWGLSRTWRQRNWRTHTWLPKTWPASRRPARRSQTKWAVFFKAGGSELVSQNRVQASADILIVITPIILKYLISILTPYMSVPCLNSGPHWHK